MLTPEDEAEIKRFSENEWIWRFTLQSRTRMTVYKPRALAFAEARRWAADDDAIIKTERRTPDGVWVEVGPDKADG